MRTSELPHSPTNKEMQGAEPGDKAEKEEGEEEERKRRRREKLSLS